MSKAIQALSIREGWIYRDWQTAIGDLMVRNVESGDRMYEVIGYRDFEAICIDGDAADKTWLRRLHTLVDGLDSHGDPATDARIYQLRNVYRATAKIIVALDKTDPETRIAEKARSEALAVSRVAELI